MSRYWLPAIALFALSAKAQNINFPDIPHIHTALNHLTVIDVGEPIQFIAGADPDSFQIERVGDKVLLQPLKDGAATNLVVWTASRQLSYELDVPGDTTKMNVIVRTVSASIKAASGAPTAKDRQQIASTATTQALLASQDIVAERETPIARSGVSVSVFRVLHTADGAYLQYRVVNRSEVPFRVTTPSIVHLTPTQIPISLLSLRNTELCSQTLDRFKVKSDGILIAASGQSQQTDVSPGASTTGYVLIREFRGAQPEMYQLNFGSVSASALIDTVVL